MEKCLSIKYAPKKFEDILLTSRVKELITGGAHHLYLYGEAGTGKSTVAKVVSGWYDLGKRPNVLIINGSVSGGVDTVRREVLDFATTYSFDLEETQTQKYIILEEIDGSSQEFRKALRQFIEKYEGSVTFILTSNETSLNHLKGFDRAFYNRFNRVFFNPKDKGEEKELKKIYGERLMEICEKEGFEFDKTNKDDKIKLLRIINDNFPSFRGCLKTLSAHQVSKKLPNVEDSLNYTSEVLEKTIKNILTITPEYANKLNVANWVHNDAPNAREVYTRLQNFQTIYEITEAKGSLEKISDIMNLINNHVNIVILKTVIDEKFLLTSTLFTIRDILNK